MTGEDLNKYSQSSWDMLLQTSVVHLTVLKMTGSWFFFMMSNHIEKKSL